MTLEQVIKEFCAGNFKTVRLSAKEQKELAARIRREFCVKEHDWDWFFDEHKGWWKCTRCGAEKQEKK